MSGESKGTVNTKHKDRLFNFIFGREENREWTLSLYNAINESHHTDASLIEFNTLENVLYLDMRNDTSFIVSDIMSVYEHQSSFNPNMPLRMLEYVGATFSGYVAKNRLNKYGSKLIKLPIPKLVVFYNGEQRKEDETILLLSDSFNETNKERADVEVRVRMLNVNYGHNRNLMDHCRPLFEYAWFINEIRKNQKQHGLNQSVNLAIQAMPRDFIIKEFLAKHKAEVEGMLDTEYNEEEVKELFKEEGREEGRYLRDIEIVEHMIRKGKAAEVIADDCNIPIERIREIEQNMLASAK